MVAFNLATVGLELGLKQKACEVVTVGATGVVPKFTRIEVLLLSQVPSD
jgi:hypothetical protein